MSDNNRQQEPEKSLFDQLPLDQVRTVILVFLFGGGIITGIWSTFFGGGLTVGSLLANLSAGLVSSGFTFIAIDLVLGQREKREAEKREEKIRAEVEERTRKILQENAIARLKQAGTPKERQPILDEMIRLNLLKEMRFIGGDLSKSRLMKGNLSKARLSGINLYEATLDETNFESADLTHAGLISAALFYANLTEVDLRYSLMDKATLRGANLQGANLSESNLIGASLGDANLEDANLHDAIFDTSTRLPDETFWMPSIDMSRFTDASHPEFWRSDNPNSPAYRGKSETEDEV